MASKKQKGGAFERKVCRWLSEWAAPGRDDVFWRTAMSGGRSTIGQRSGKPRLAQLGDICAIDSRGEPFLSRFVVEAKSYASLSWDGLIYDNKTGCVREAWDKTMYACDKFGREPFIVLKQNAKDPVLVTTLAGARLLEICNDLGAPQGRIAFFSRLKAHVFMLEDALQRSKPSWLIKA